MLSMRVTIVTGRVKAGVKNLLKDDHELLGRKDLGAIFIATASVFHTEYAIAAMKSGRPVYGEKTLGFSPS
jgi:predicted dehydrogenase